MTEVADAPTGREDEAEGVDAEFDRRVQERLAVWNSSYEEKGVQPASPLMDEVLAEEQVMEEMKSEGRW